jgi:oligopeptide transport system substrate-binding protein
MRKALSLAINRSDLVEHVLQGNQSPACGIVPPSFLSGGPYFKDGDAAMARKLFQQALEEQGLSQSNLAPIAIYYASGERPHKIAQVIQQQWKKELGIEASLQSNEPKVYFERLKNCDYQVGVGSWFADFCDPLSFLEIFKQKSNGTNHTQWENERFASLLEQSSLSEKPERETQLAEAEQILIEEMPVIPLFFSTYNYVKHPSVKGVSFSELGYLDFKNAYLER